MGFCFFAIMTGSSAFPWNQARFDAGELITQRELVSRQVSDDLTEQAVTFGLILDDLSLTFGKFTQRWKPNRWLSRKQRGPDLWWKR